ncbi:MAG: lysozyme family protein [Lachnospiraceae bacterium]|nr:lysozyme family protein [Lachnospiraceae bacterium]MBP3458897.1 lysozyme family protein [Lachnospiraceae bacterium]
MTKRKKRIGKIIGILASLSLVSGIVMVAAISSMTTQMVAVLIGGEEEEYRVSEGPTSNIVGIPISDTVEFYREKVLKEAKKYGMESYIDLFLAVMMQESGGNGSDVFQCSESLGKPPNSLTIEESIAQGVKYLTAMLQKAKVNSPEDMDHIRLALQGYNFGGSYIDYAVKKDGGWTQLNTFDFAREKSGGVRNTGGRVQQLGPWRYGDQYYTQHVLRYYCTANQGSAGTTAVNVPVEKRLEWLFPNGMPTSPEQMQQYLVQIRVPILNTKGKSDTMGLTVHKKLAFVIQEVFKELKQNGFKTIPSETAGYHWRMMASNSQKISHHSYGCVVDLNWTHNGASYTGWGYDPGKDEYSVTKKEVDIWKKYGFYWGGDWSKSYFDPMHFTYTDH